MKRALSLVAVFAAVLALGFIAPAGAQLIYTAPGPSGLFAGVNAGNGTLTNGDNTGIGYYSLYSLTSGFWNTGVGSNSLKSVTTGVSNTGVGMWALTSMQGGGRNTAVGQGAMGNSADSCDNVALGYNSLLALHTGGDSLNSVVGFQAMSSLYEGKGNSALGAYAGEPLSSGFNNTFLGYNSGPSVDGLINATAVGYNAKVAANNSLVLGGTGSDAVKVGIGTTTPTQALDVNGNTIRVRQSRTPASSSDACAQGEIAWDGSYIYVCVATNTWMRSALSTF